MNVKLITSLFAILVFVVSVYFAARPDTSGSAEFALSEQPLLGTFAIEKVYEVEISSPEETVSVIKKIVQEKERDVSRWFVKSAWNYEADRKRIDEFLDKLRGLKKGQPCGSNKELYDKFGLEEGKRSVVRLKDQSGSVMAGTWPRRAP